MPALSKTRILSILLLASLALNVGGACWLAGRSAAPAGGFRGALKQTVRNLPPEQREAAMEVVRGYRPALNREMEAVLRQRQDIRALIQRGDMSRQQLEEAFAELRRRTTAAQETGHAMAVEIIANLPPEQRQELAGKKSSIMP